MGTSYNPKIIINGLILNLDAANRKSYPTTGTDWTDLTKNKYNFTLYNAPTYSSSNNGILTFAKASLQYADYITTFSNLSTWTAEVWVKFTTVPVSGTEFPALITGLFDLSTKVNFTLGVVGVPADGLIRAGFFNGSWRNTGGHQPVLGIWYQYVGTYDGSNIVLYVNGQSFSSTAYTGTPQSGGGIRIARRWDSTLSSVNLIDGSIPIARLYNRALTASEVLQNYNATKGRFGL